MDSDIIKQIQQLQEFKHKYITATGQYVDVEKAIAGLQICSTFGLDLTARMISLLKTNNVLTYEDLQKLISFSSILTDRVVIKNVNDTITCPNCNAILDKENKEPHCSKCGQKLKWTLLN